MTTNAVEAPNREGIVSPETEKQFNRIFILNRGEIAFRILRTCQKMGIGAVVGFSDADANSLAVREALRLQKEDDRFAVAYLGASNQKESYMNYSNAADQAQAYGCQAVHPGYGFGAEEPEAAQAFLERGIKFIGPSPEVLVKTGDKANAIEIAKQLGIPTIPGSEILKNYWRGHRAARKLGYPVIAKATVGGGGHHEVIANNDQLHSIFPILQERMGNFYFEKYLTKTKHIEFQIAADQHGNVVCLGERDCSAQRDFQKVLEESPASAVAEETRKKMTEYAINMATVIGYENLCTVEFLYDCETGQCYFMEINPRLQVEHPVTEMQTNLDLVEMQIRIAQGEKLPEFQFQKTHVMETRIYAEGKDFKSDSGKIYHLQIPEGNGVRTDVGYEEDDTIPSEYDKTMLKIIVEAPTRQEAITKMAMALHNFEATGVATNKEFLLWLISQPDFVDNKITTNFIKDTWEQHKQQGFRDLSPFLGTGNFEEDPIPRRLVAEALPQNFVYIRRGSPRNYIDEIIAFQRSHPDSCAYRPGWWEKDGIKFALGIWDYSAFGGTLGAEEGNAVMAHFEKASKLGLPLLMVINSGGARQQENSLALQQMDAMVANARRYQVPFFGILYINSFGGINASIAEQADVKFIIEGGEAGLTGPDIIQNTQGEQQDRSHYAAHSSGSHAWYRNTDLVVANPGEAIERFMHLLSILKSGNSITKEGAFIYPKQLSTIDSIAPLYRAPQHFRFKALVTDFSHFAGHLLSRLRNRREVSSEQEEHSNEDIQKLLDSAYRPTSAEFLSEELGVFDSIAPLSNMILVEEAHQYPPIIGAIARLNGRPMMVLGQQAQRRKVDGHYVKEYVGIRPEDLNWARRKVVLADRLGIDITLLADTSGAAADERAEQGGIQREISYFLSATYDAGVNVYSFLHGYNGSGGGLTFARRVNWSGETSNAQSRVSDSRVMARILNGHQPTAQELSSIINQSRDSRPEIRLAMGLTDEVIYEPPGGTQTNPFVVARQLRTSLGKVADVHQNYTRAQTQEEKYQRSISAAQFATRPL